MRQPKKQLRYQDVLHTQTNMGEYFCQKIVSKTLRILGGEEDKDFVTAVLRPNLVVKSVTMGDGCKKLSENA